MGLLQKALETYEAMEKIVGLYEEGKEEPLAPIGHIVTKAQIEVTINADGAFKGAKLADKDKKIIIPVTEESAGRTSSPAAHPLCEQLGYLLGDDEVKFNLYISNLTQWCQSAYAHPKAKAILVYIQQRTLRSDLINAGMSPDKGKDMVCWRVLGLGIDDKTAVWEDVDLMKAYSSYYLSQKQGETNLCMLTGEDTHITWQHLKGAFSLNGNAKIISANDSANFTYRGRFAEPEEAASVGYLASQKAHNALKWIISTQGAIQGGRAFVCWNPQGRTVPKLTLPFLFQFEEEEALPDYRSYREDLKRKLVGYQDKWQPEDQVIIAAFDAATTGRLAITYYNEMLGSDFLDRLAYWDETCCWKDYYHGVQSPLLYNMIAFAFGTQRGEAGKVEPDEKLIAPQMQRLLSCRIDQAAFPLDIMQALVSKAGNLQVYSKANRNKLLCITCAAIRKYYIDRQKGEIKLALEPERKDRSYQWGRLLAVMEKIERDTYDQDEKREPNAIRMQSVLVKRPGYAFMVIMEQLKNAYYPRLHVGLRTKYEKLIGEIMEQIHLSLKETEKYGDPLSESYLPGYYLQKSVLYTKKDNEETEEHSDEV
ncbi:MAG: type I-C CRISPR-associated protein Cas8c/Csd1 [Clostridia bacterium]|nr:type I-C CRISPR-associated protein Cas8c/Csd1 [Clostridia bacterium]